MIFYIHTQILAHINGTDGTVPLAEVVTVDNETRLTFYCRNCSCENKFCWSVGNGPIPSQEYHMAPNFYEIDKNTQSGICINKFKMTITENSTIHCIQDYTAIESTCCAHKMCTRNVSAKFILVVVKDKSTDISTCRYDYYNYTH